MTPEVCMADIRACSNDAQKVVLFKEMYLKIYPISAEIVIALLNQVQEQKTRDTLFYRSMENLLCDFDAEEVKEIGKAIGIEQEFRIVAPQ